MENKELGSVFKLVGQLMELHGENKFKVRSYSNAAFQLGKYPHKVHDLDPSSYESIPGIGKNLVPKLEELVRSGEMTYLNQWIEKTPDGVIQMMAIKGIGPSKVRTIWEDMEIESVGELLYACNENRLVDLKGFGAKTQEQVRLVIEFMLENELKFHYASIESLVTEIKAAFKRKYPQGLISEAGEMLRRDPVINELDFVCTEDLSTVLDLEQHKIPINQSIVSPSDFERELFLKSAHTDHISKLDSLEGVDAKEIYGKNGFKIIPAEMRNGQDEYKWSEQHQEGDLVDNQDLKGCLHNHSTYSDGIHDLRKMAEHLKMNGYEYFGISDHSKTAVYAGGLRSDDILRQHLEIDELNKDLAPFKILKGIESDILSDGSLDYETDILKSFDFIVASIHSNMKMDEETANRRLLRAIENPYTSILGHPTGRLLLSRPGYPIDHRMIIDACAANNVSIELNSNPMRLDIDWTWIPYCMEKGVKISINPDAHRIEGFDHMRYGVMTARKGGLTKEMTLNALKLDSLETYFRR
ncbi:MAG: DNA polymerase/3'-5' exonuclease PolX [Flavobacteriales bacterium]|nr:DNA polymerase/3'-5' exonuclease PolX [Flavobacteriales bacterium]NCG29847.1 DNA polymerase/3'-5' exonuclease PolX [Bacteroidota bacterium]MBT3964472.1 DNA polymerase/3'-5' exonuclease PolX [Flavobacteriales bacterium]MBT4704849.1 DNA polymerase/3'-5' exonuclease PolX [Flavobacteriales bacterium]MBT4929624.1 DNA polymerase/3'-5' exonuclease PolX [Flavobacteriales bacterium]